MDAEFDPIAAIETLTQQAAAQWQLAQDVTDILVRLKTNGDCGYSPETAKLIVQMLAGAVNAQHEGSKQFYSENMACLLQTFEVLAGDMTEDIELSLFKVNGLAVMGHVPDEDEEPVLIPVN